MDPATVISRTAAGVMFSASSVRFRKPAGPQAYSQVQIVLVRAGTGEAVTGGGRTVALRPGAGMFVPSGATVTIVPDGTMSLIRVLIAADVFTVIVGWEFPDRVFDLVSAQLVADQAYPNTVTMFDLNEIQRDQAGRFVDELVMLTTTGAVADNVWWAACQVLGVLATVMPAIRKPAPPGKHVSLGSAEPVGSETPIGQGGVADIISAACVPTRLGRIVRLAVFWIRGHFRSRWTLADVAGAVGASVSGLSRAFRRQIGRSVLYFRDRLRVGELARLLAEEHMGVAQAARAVGWASTSQASLAFQKVTGMVPGAWRDQAVWGDRRDRVNFHRDLTQNRP